MKRKLAIYLAGTIKKNHEKTDETHWTEENLHVLRRHLEDFDVSFLNPALRTDNLSDQFSVFGRDMLQVFCSDVVFVDARDRRGLGVGAEMMWAKVNKIPVVIWAPRDTHYHMGRATILGVPVTNYVHPFVAALGDAIVETLEEGAVWIKAAQSNPGIEIKGMDHIKEAMEHYKITQLERDGPMIDLINVHEDLKKGVSIGQLIICPLYRGSDYSE